MKILIIGDSCTDKFIYGECKRLCPEAPVPVFSPINSTRNDGMAKNVFNNLRSLAPDWDIDFITNSNDIMKTRIVDVKTNQMLLRIDDNDKCPRFTDLDKLENYDAVIISDYNKGFLTKEDIKYIIDKYPLTFIDSKKIFGKWINNASFIKINQSEYEKNKENLIDYKNQLIVTLGEKGVEWNNLIHPPSRQAEVSDLSGAGDTFFAAFIYHYLSHKSISNSIYFAQNCSLEVIEKKGVVIVENNLDT
jgi:D-beta-D-heptose 7-phosphate kinase/D-beta-D-heptose 1-phosphate adenosyltransferase